MATQFAHSLLFVCPNCKSPIFIGCLSVKRNIEDIDDEHFAVSCLINMKSWQKAECQVVATKTARDGKIHIGFEFMSAELNFWKMFFPAASVKPLLRGARPHFDPSRAEIDIRRLARVEVKPKSVQSRNGSTLVAGSGHSGRPIPDILADSAPSAKPSSS